MAKRAVLYARVSGNDRMRTGGENLQDQTRLCQDYARQRGYHIVMALSEDDRGASGATFDLPELSKALDMARTRQYEVLVVRELDRLSRDLAKQLIVEQELKRAGVVIEYVLYDFPDTPEGRLNKNLRAMLAEYEREKINQRMTRGRRRKVKEGHVLTGHHAPFGYEIVELDGKRMLSIVEKEAAVIRMIFEWYTKGDGDGIPLSGNAIANKLTAMRVPTVTELRGEIVPGRVRAPGAWAQSTVARILGRETYVGLWHYCKDSDHEEIPVEVPAIIDQKTWEIARVRKQANRHYSKRNTKYKYLMRQRLRCPSCGRKMSAYTFRTGKNVYSYYRCHSRFDNTPCDNPWNYRVLDVDAATWAWIIELTTDDNKMVESLRRYQAEREEILLPLRERGGVIDNLLAENKVKLDRLLDLYLAGNFEQEILVERQSILETERTSLLNEQARVKAQIQEQAFSEERFREITEFAQVIRSGAISARDDFDKRRRLLEALNMWGQLETVEGQKSLRLTCVIGGAEMQIVCKTTLYG